MLPFAAVVGIKMTCSATMYMLVVRQVPLFSHLSLETDSGLRLCSYSSYDKSLVLIDCREECDLTDDYVIPGRATSTTIYNLSSD